MNRKGDDRFTDREFRRQGSRVGVMVTSGAEQRWRLDPRRSARGRLFDPDCIDVVWKEDL